MRNLIGPHRTLLYGFHAYQDSWLALAGPIVVANDERETRTILGDGATW